MTLNINGEAREIEISSLTIHELLNHLNLPLDHIAVELNLNIVPKVKFLETRLHEGDKIEIVQFVGGG